MLCAIYGGSGWWIPAWKPLRQETTSHQLRWIASAGFRRLGMIWKLPVCGEEGEVVGHDSTVVEGYVERSFQDAAPSFEEADVYIAEIERDFAKDEE